MKLFAISDLHVGYPENREVLAQLRPDSDEDWLIVAGIVIGPSVLGFVEPTEVLEVFSELGVVFLLFVVGLETKL